MSEDVSETYRRNVERPTEIVRTALRMILGAGLAVALILKVYMLVLTDLTCVAEETSLGALIRCAGWLDLIGYSLAVAAGVEAAASLFIRSRNEVRDALVLAFGAGAILALARDLGAAAGWRESLSVVSLVLCLLLLRAFWNFSARGSGD
ncbi:MAG: hypothetical protein AAFU55_03220 [Pseudomonadota bacterium]